MLADVKLESNGSVISKRVVFEIPLPVKPPVGLALLMLKKVSMMPSGYCTRSFATAIGCTPFPFAYQKLLQGCGL
jgi:hypothetical protein